MQLTKFGHACVRLERNGEVLVIDPGVFTDPAALDGANAVLITHEHADHLDEQKLRAAVEADPGLRIWTNGAVAEQLSGLGPGRVQVVGDGDLVPVLGFEVEVHGEWHAVIHPDIPRVRNVGFLIDGQVFHPGDALTVPERTVPTLLLPVHAPWSKASEVVDYVRAVGAARAYAVHDSLLTPPGLALYQRQLDALAPRTPYTRLEIGQSVAL